MARIFTLIKRSKKESRGRVRWNWELEWYDDQAPEHSPALRTYQQPSDDLVGALGSLVPYALTALDLPSTYDDPLDNDTQSVAVRSVRFEESGLRIVTVKQLSSGEIVTLPQPLIPNEDVEGSAELFNVRLAAALFVDGIRKQLDLFERPADIGDVMEAVADVVNSGALDTGNLKATMEVS